MHNSVVILWGGGVVRRGLNANEKIQKKKNTIKLLN